MQIDEVPADLVRHYPASYYAGAGEPAPLERHEGLAGMADRARKQQQLFGGSRLTARGLRRWMPATGVDARRSAAFVQRAGLRSFSDPILDVGCGRIPGHLLNLRRLGFDQLTGVDPFLEGDGQVEGIRLRRQSIHEVAGSFQLVTMHHAFEHVADPLETMISARGLLRPAGVFLVRTPVMGTWFWETYGPSWWELDPPRHLFIHTVDSLVHLATAAGLELFDTVWDSSFVEMIASDQIRRDIAWREPASWGEESGRRWRALRHWRPHSENGRAQFGSECRTRWLLLPTVWVDTPADALTSSVRNRVRTSPRLRALVVGLRAFVRGPANGTAGPPAAAPLPAGWDHVAEIRRVDLRRASSEVFRLNLIVPTIHPAAAFGGVSTALGLFDELARTVALTRIISLAATPETMPDGWGDYQAVDLASEATPARSVVSIAGGGEASLAVGRGDVFLATFWTTAALAHAIRRWQSAAFGRPPLPMAYLIQDYEPGFSAWSAQSALARATYGDSQGTIAIFNTGLLRDYFHANGLRFSREFVFEPHLPPALRPFVPSGPKPRSRQIVVYGRPKTPRNAFPLIVDGLRAWVAMYEDAGSWSIVSVGQAHPPIELGRGVTLTSRGKLSLEAYGLLLAESAIGISLMISPHPSYPPLEMAQLGLLVLTNRFDGKDLATWHTNIESLEEDSADGLARQLAVLCRAIEADPARGANGRSSRPAYLSDEPQFGFAEEVAAILRQG